SSERLRPRHPGEANDEPELLRLDDLVPRGRIRADDDVLLAAHLEHGARGEGAVREALDRHPPRSDDLIGPLLDERRGDDRAELGELQHGTVYLAGSVADQGIVSRYGPVPRSRGGSFVGASNWAKHSRSFSFRA